MKPRILITGSSGMLGSDLCKELDKDYKMIGADVIARPGGPKQSLNCDITDKRSVFQVVKKARPDIVIHAAAMTDVDGCELDPKKAYSINSSGTRNVAKACKAAGAAFIYISTDFVFDGKKKRPYTETDKPRPLSVYGRSKLKGEEAVRKALKRYFILRTSWLYGKNGKNFVDTIIAKAKRGEPLKVVDDQAGSPTYTKDLARAIAAILKRITNYKLQITNYGTYHVSNSGAVSWFDYAREILKLAGSKTKVIPISSAELARPAKRPAMSVLNNSKFAGLTGCRMRNWREALKEYVQ